MDIQVLRGLFPPVPAGHSFPVSAPVARLQRALPKIPFALCKVRRIQNEKAISSAGAEEIRRRKKESETAPMSHESPEVPRRPDQSMAADDR